MKVWVSWLGEHSSDFVIFITTGRDEATKAEYFLRAVVDIVFGTGVSDISAEKALEYLGFSKSEISRFIKKVENHEFFERADDESWEDLITSIITDNFLQVYTYAEYSVDRTLKIFADVSPLSLIIAEEEAEGLLVFSIKPDIDNTVLYDDDSVKSILRVLIYGG